MQPAQAIAEAEAEQKHFDTLKSMAEEAGDWKGYQWIMQKRFPERWGRDEGRRPAAQTAAVIATNAQVVVAEGSKQEYMEALRRAQPQLPQPEVVEPPTQENDDGEV